MPDLSLSSDVVLASVVLGVTLQLKIVMKWQWTFRKHLNGISGSFVYAQGVNKAIWRLILESLEKMLCENIVLFFS